MVGVGEFEQLDGRAVFDDERDADAVGWAISRNQDFAAADYVIDETADVVGSFPRADLEAPSGQRSERQRRTTLPIGCNSHTQDQNARTVPQSRRDRARGPNRGRQAAL